MLTTAERRALLALARQAIAAAIGGGPAPDRSAPDLPPVRAGAFVTIHRSGDLRGCIGSVESDRPVSEAVARCAVSAAREDPRFPPVTADELGAIDIEISVLEPLEPLDPIDASRIAIGRDGLVAEEGFRRGLLLPQVAVEWGWDAPTFLAQTCAKAGLPRDAWRRGARIYRFGAEVFGERGADPRTESS